MEQSRPTGAPSGDELRRATFPQAFKGYDREAVHAFLGRVADWMEGRSPAVEQAMPDVRRELERVGERTAGVLTAAEEAAAKLRSEAAEYAASVREAADEEVRRMRVEGGRRVEEMIGEAEAKAEKIIDEAIARRRRLNQAITSLLERRDEIAEEAQRLAEELLGAVDALRADRPEDEPSGEREEDGEDQPVDEAVEADSDEAQDAEEPGPTGRFKPQDGAEPTELEPPEERETTVHRTS